LHSNRLLFAHVVLERGHARRQMVSTGSGRHYEAKWEFQTSVPLRTRRLRELAGTGADVALKEKQRVGSGAWVWLGSTSVPMHIRLWDTLTLPI
jgi:hypothetical protein